LSLKKVTRVTSHYLYYDMRSKSKCSLSARAQVHNIDAGGWRHLPAAHSITVWLRAARSLLMRHFSSSTSEILVR